MHSAPYFERLSEAYAVVGGIPDHQVTLDIERVSIAADAMSIGVNGRRYIAPADWDGLVLTPDIWLSLCPPYIEIVEPLIEKWEPYGLEVFWRIENRLTSRFEIAMAHLFNLTPELAEDLFGMRADDEIGSRSDRQVFLDRVLMFLKANGEEVSVGIGHVDQDEMLEHGISMPEKAPSDIAEAAIPDKEARTKNAVDRPPPMRTGFAALAMENDTPGPETFDTEASATTVNPVVHEQSVEQDKT